VIAVVGIVSVWSASGSPPPPTPVEAAPEGADLAAAFDAVEQEAEADVATEETAETERAADAPPATVAALDTLAPSRPVALDGATIDNMILHGNFARSQGQYDQAVRYFSDVIASDATNGRALAGLTRTYQERGDFAEAARVARLMLDAHPDHPANFVLLADLLDARGDHDGAIAVLEDVTYRFPRYAPGQERLDAFRRAARIRARSTP
jgi:tetratricopeptide (TPR) repeat protein